MENTATADTLFFSYDADGLRISKTDNNATTKYYYTGGKLTQMTTPDGTTLHFMYDVIGPAAVIYGVSTYYYLRNAQGDVIGLVDSSGNRVVSYSYDAWGGLLSITGSEATGIGEDNPLRYRGYIYDNETGLYYLKSRYYNPTWGRFINADSPAVPTISPDSATLNKNLFSYCDNNPVNKVDSSGNCGCAVVGALVGGIFGGLASKAAGDGFWAGFQRGAITGGIAGLATDFVIISGGTGAAALFVVWSGGVCGSLLGDARYTAMTGKSFSDREMFLRAVSTGFFNMAGMTASREFAKAAGPITKTFLGVLKYEFVPETMDLLSMFYAVGQSLIGDVANESLVTLFESDNNTVTTQSAGGANSGSVSGGGGGGTWRMMYV